MSLRGRQSPCTDHNWKRGDDPRSSPAKIKDQDSKFRTPTKMFKVAGYLLITLTVDRQSYLILIITAK